MTRRLPQLLPLAAALGLLVACAGDDLDAACDDARAYQDDLLDGSESVVIDDVVGVDDLAVVTVVDAYARDEGGGDYTWAYVLRPEDGTWRLDDTVDDPADAPEVEDTLDAAEESEIADRTEAWIEEHDDCDLLTEDFLVEERYRR